MSSGKSTVVGYRYAFSIHMGLARGPVNVLKHIKCGGLTAFEGDIFTTYDLSINKPDLFGGDTREGGLNGTMSILMGDAAQVVSSRIKSLLGGFVPDFIGTLTTFWSGQVTANNPYPKPWAYRMARWSEGWDLDASDPYREEPWYEPKARIRLAGDTIDAMNPAHILYECFTNRLWGRGYHPTVLLEDAWVSAANQLCSELFGICIRYNRQSDLGEFINAILAHIGGRIYPDPETGKLVLYLIRKDYVVDDLPTFDYDSGLLEATQDETGSQSNFFSEIIVEYTDPITGNSSTVTEQNNALVQATGSIVSTTAKYPGLPTADLARRVARRDLDTQIASKRMKLIFDRRAWKLTPGAPFKVSIPDHGITSMIMRVGDITDSEFTDGRITITAIEDFFGLADAGYSNVPDPVWEPPDTTPVAPSVRLVGEATYRDLTIAMTDSEIATVPDDVGYISVFAKQPTSVAINYDLATAAYGETMAVRSTGDWTPSALTADTVGYYDTYIELEAGSILDDAQVGEAVYLDDEIMTIMSVDTDTNTIEVKRGCVDTIPTTHEAGARMWFYEGFAGTDGRPYADLEDVEVRILTVTSSGRLEMPDVSGDVITIQSRQARPYPPADVKVEGDPFGSLSGPYTGEITVSWVQRNRVIQSDVLLAHEEPGVSHEAGTTYTIRIYDGTSLTRTTTGLTGTSWKYDNSMISSDGEPSAPGWWFELESVRDGLTSFQHYRFYVQRRV